MSTQVLNKKPKILVVNPNSSKAMTQSMQRTLRTPDITSAIELDFYTAPLRAPSSIDDGGQIKSSADVVLFTPVFSAIAPVAAAAASESSPFDDTPPPPPLPLPPLPRHHSQYQGILIACFSVHPLVSDIRRLPDAPKAVTGILEASVLAALALLTGAPRGAQWGIVTTGRFWEEHLTAGVKAFLGTHPRDTNARFAGVESTGLNAGDFHSGAVPAETIKGKIKEAAKRLLSRPGVTVIVMGCAGMAGLEVMIRTAAVEAKGADFAFRQLHIVDGLQAGVYQLDALIKQLRQRPG